MSDLVRVERKGRVTTVILNRPASRNAVNARPPRRCARRSSNSTGTTPRRWPYSGVRVEPFVREPI